MGFVLLMKGCKPLHLEYQLTSIALVVASAVKSYAPGLTRFASNLAFNHSTILCPLPSNNSPEIFSKTTAKDRLRNWRFGAGFILVLKSSTPYHAPLLPRSKTRTMRRLVEEGEGENTESTLDR